MGKIILEWLSKIPLSTVEIASWKVAWYIQLYYWNAHQSRNLTRGWVHNNISTVHTGPEWNRFVQKLFWCFYSHKRSIFWAYTYLWYQIWIINFSSFSTFYYAWKKSRSYFLVNVILFQIATTSTIFKLHRCVTPHWKANSPYFSLMVHFFRKN